MSQNITALSSQEMYTQLLIEIEDSVIELGTDISVTARQKRLLTRLQSNVKQAQSLFLENFAIEATEGIKESVKESESIEPEPLKGNPLWDSVPVLLTLRPDDLSFRELIQLNLIRAYLERNHEIEMRGLMNIARFDLYQWDNRCGKLWHTRHGWQLESGTEYGDRIESLTRQIPEWDDWSVHETESKEG